MKSLQTSVNIYVEKVTHPILKHRVVEVMDMAILSMGSSLAYQYDAKRAHLIQIKDQLAQAHPCTLDYLADKIAQFGILTHRPRSNYLSFLFKPAKTGETNSAKIFASEMNKIYDKHPNLAIRVTGFLVLGKPIPIDENLANKRQAKPT